MRRNEHIVCVFPQSRQTHSNNQQPTIEKHWKLFQRKFAETQEATTNTVRNLCPGGENFIENIFSFLLAFFFFASEFIFWSILPLITIAFHTGDDLQPNNSNRMETPTKFIYLIFQLNCRFEYICHLMRKIPIGCAVRTNEIDRLDSTCFFCFDEMFAMLSTRCNLPTYSSYTICRCTKKYIFFSFEHLTNGKNRKLPNKVCCFLLYNLAVLVKLTFHSSAISVAMPTSYHRPLSQIEEEKRRTIVQQKVTTEKRRRKSRSADRTWWWIHRQFINNSCAKANGGYIVS